MQRIADAEMFHGFDDAFVAPFKEAMKKQPLIHERSLSYDFFLHQHPYVTELVSRLLEGSVRGLQEADTEDTGQTLSDGSPRPVLYEEFFGAYAPTTRVDNRPVKDLDFSLRGAYAEYNWELFFHIPLTVAIHLSKNGRHEDAQRWFHYVFDPTDDSDGPAPQRFWKVRPFRTTDARLIEEILVNLATGADPELRKDTIASIHAWQEAPFRPHVVARYRPTAYMFKTVMAYLDNLVAWGDSLFRQDTRESIAEATQHYVLAAAILGPRPQEVPRHSTTRPQTYASLRPRLDDFSNALAQLETDIPFDVLPPPPDSPDGDGADATIASLGNALYFCVPQNARLLSYWDTVADRLFKIRNSLNILGIFRQLPLFEPPIDPALLARAAAAGIDVAAVASGVNQPLPLVRFSLLVQKAAEISQEVKSLGNSLLGALEKSDGEAMQILRARHERVMLELAENVRYSQWQESIKSREGLEKSMANAVARYVYYERQLGQQASQVEVPALEALDVAALQKMKLKASEPEVALREIQIDVVRAIQGLPGAYPMSTWEATELGLTVASNVLQVAAGVLDLAAAPLSLIPQVQVRATPWGIGAGGTFGGRELAGASGYMASMSRTLASAAGGAASISGKVGSYARRSQEWEFQSNVIAGEITQLYKQLRAAQIREAITEREWHNHQQHIEHAREIEEFLTNDRTGKTTNQAFYAWMKREVKGVYNQCFEFAFDVARKAERALQQELGDPDVSFLQFNYLSGHQGLLAGEKLHLDVKRMEMAYHDLNRRGYELTKHVSLMQLDPEALLRLRLTGRCTFVLPEELYDLGGAGEYFRRHKSLAVSVLGVAGPYTSVNAKVTLLKSSIRKSPLLVDGEYARQGTEDPRFSDHFGSLESIVTSSGQNDSGLFETNLRDERLLPFEGLGAVCELQVELPEVRQFDYNTIADLVVHVRYTAREGGQVLKAKANENLEARFQEAQALSSVRLFSVRHEFPSEWARFTSQSIGAANPTAPLTLTLREEHYPFWSRGRLDEVRSVEIYARTAKTTVEVSDDAANKDTLVKDTSLGGLRRGMLANVPLPAAVGTFEWNFNDTSMQDLWIGVAWAKS